MDQMRQNLAANSTRNGAHECALPAADGEEEKRTLLASDGAGPLLQRDYSAVLEGSQSTPEQVMQRVLTDFPQFSPDELAAFSCDATRQAPLSAGAEMQINIKAAGLCHVRIVHVNERSLTMRTLDGHPEAGRITFGAYYDSEGQLVFRIRSRARASSTLKYIGYQLFGKVMQTQVWITFIKRVAESCGGTIRGEVQITEAEVSGTIADTGGLDTPTFTTEDKRRQ